MMFSINDELQEFKTKLRSLQLDVVKVEKVGNGNMAAFKIFYRSPGNPELKEHFFWRHDLDKTIAQFEEAYRK